MKDLARLALVFTALLVVGAANWLLANSSPDITPVAAETGNLQIASSQQLEDLVLKTVNLVQARTRPLFEQSRRPWVAPTPQIVTPSSDLAAVQIDVPLPETTTAPEPLDAKLIGIQQSPTATMVLISDSSGTTAEWFKVGSTYKEWKIGKTTANSVLLENNGKTFKLELYPTITSGAVTP